MRRTKFKKNCNVFTLMNQICAVLVFLITLLSLVMDIVLIILTGEIAPFIIWSIIFILLLISSYYYFVIIKTKVKDLTCKQTKFVKIFSTIHIASYSTMFVTMMFIIIGCLIFGFLKGNFVICSFIGVALFSLILLIDNIYIEKKLKNNDKKI